AEGDFESVTGANTLGLDEEGVDLVIGQAFEGEMPDAVSQNIQDAKDGITSGDIEVPCSASGCN
ncbi:BMP family ABC transporter substrate-binding protein, partial [Halorubrum distributum]